MAPQAPWRRCQARWRPAGRPAASIRPAEPASYRTAPCKCAKDQEKGASTQAGRLRPPRGSCRGASEPQLLLQVVDIDAALLEVGVAVQVLVEVGVGLDPLHQQLVKRRQREGQRVL